MSGTPHAALPSRRDIWLHMLLYPGHTLPTALAPVLVACGLAVRDGAFAPLPALAALLAGWLIQLGGVLVDNRENLVRHPDDREHPALVHALRAGALTLPGLRAAILGCYGGALLCGFYLVTVGGGVVIAIGLASMAASWVYSAGPLPLGSKGLADPLFFLFFGAVSVAGTYYVQALPGAMPWMALALSMPVGALTTCILIIDDIRDREFDAQKGKCTVAVRFGAGWSRAEFCLLLASAYAAPPALLALPGFGAGVLLPLLTLPAALLMARSVLRTDGHAALQPMTPRMAMLLLAYSALLGIGTAIH